MTQEKSDVVEVFDIVRNSNDISSSDGSSIFLNAPLLNRHIQEYIRVRLVVGGGMLEEEFFLFCRLWDGGIVEFRRLWERGGGIRSIERRRRFTLR